MTDEETVMRRLQSVSAGPDLLAFLDLLERRLGASWDELDQHPSPRISIQQSTALAFAAHELVDIDTSDGPNFSLTTAFFGLAGAVTPLPLHFAEELDTDDEYGNAAGALLGLFHERLVCLMVHAARASEPAWSCSSAAGGTWREIALAWLSLNEVSTELPGGLLLRLAPVLAAGLRTAPILQHTLEVALEDALGDAALQVQPWAGSWAKLSSSQVCRLGTPTARLTADAVLGGRCIHLDGKARILVGPLTTEQAEPFMRGGAVFRRVKALLDLIAPEPLEWEMVLEVLMAPSERCQLSARRLSENLWLESDVSSSPSLVQISVPLALNGT